MHRADHRKYSTLELFLYNSQPPLVPRQVLEHHDRAVEYLNKGLVSPMSIYTEKEEDLSLEYSDILLLASMMTDHWGSGHETKSSDLEYYSAIQTT